MLPGHQAGAEKDVKQLKSEQKAVAFPICCHGLRCGVMVKFFRGGGGAGFYLQGKRGRAVSRNNR